MRQSGQLRLLLNDYPIDSTNFQKFMTRWGAEFPGEEVRIEFNSDVLASDLIQTLGIIRRCGFTNVLTHASGHDGTNAGRWWVAAHISTSSLPRLVPGYSQMTKSVSVQTNGPFR